MVDFDVTDVVLVSLSVTEHISHLFLVDLEHVIVCRDGVDV